MDLFGFVKDVGRRLFDKDEEAAEKIKQHILASNPGVADLEVSFENGIVGLKGRCTRPDAFQKCVLMAGNLRVEVGLLSIVLQALEQSFARESAFGEHHWYRVPVRLDRLDETRIQVPRQGARRARPDQHERRLPQGQKLQTIRQAIRLADDGTVFTPFKHPRNAIGLIAGAQFQFNPWIRFAHARQYLGEHAVACSH